MRKNITAKMPGGDVEFDICLGTYKGVPDHTIWKGYTTAVPGLLVARLVSSSLSMDGDGHWSWRPASTWGIFHQGTGQRILYLSYKTKREATAKACRLDRFDWSGDKWPADVSADLLVRILNPTPEQVLEDQVRSLKEQLEEAEAEAKYWREEIEHTHELLDMAGVTKKHWSTAGRVELLIKEHNDPLLVVKDLVPVEATMTGTYDGIYFEAIVVTAKLSLYTTAKMDTGLLQGLVKATRRLLISAWAQERPIILNHVAGDPHSEPAIAEIYELLQEPYSYCKADGRKCSKLATCPDQYEKHGHCPF